MAGILDKMVVGINRGINTVSENSKYMLEKAQINTAIQDAERERERIYRNMGELVYNLQSGKEINITQCESMCSEILNINNKIEELNIKKQNIELQKNTDSNYDSNYMADSNDYILCECGFNNKKGAKFCAICGKQIDSKD